jgi:two-component sensor histidine kinase
MPILARLLLLLALAFLPGLAIYVYNEYDLHRTRAAQVRAELQGNAQALNDELARVLEGARNVLATVALMPLLQERDWGVCNRFLLPLHEIYPAYSGFFVVDRDARIACASDPGWIGLELGDQPYARAVLDSGAFAIGTFLIGRGSGRPVIPIMHPVRDERGRVVAGTAIELHLDWLSNNLATKPIPPSDIFVVADSEGTIIARRPDSEQWVGRKLSADLLPRVMADKPGTFEAVWHDGVRRVAGHVPPNLPPEGFYVVAAREFQAAFRPVTHATLRGLVVSGAAGLLALIGLLIGSRYFIERPVRRLVGATDALGQGRYDEITSLPRGRSEFGRLGAAFQAMAEALLARESALRHSERQTMLLAAELDHRAKNLLALIQIMLRRTRADAVADFVAKMQGRIATLARVQTLLASDRWQHTDLGKLIDEELAALSNDDQKRVRTAGPPVALTPRVAQTLAMALHELVTNAAKYGALACPDGQIAIEWSAVPESQLVVCWTETGCPTPTPPSHIGFGTQVIALGIEQQLGGQVQREWTAAGLICRLTVPASMLQGGVPPTSQA